MQKPSPETTERWCLWCGLEKTTQNVCDKCLEVGGVGKPETIRKPPPIVIQCEGCRREFYG